MRDTQGHRCAGCPPCGTRRGKAGRAGPAARWLRGQRPEQSGTGSCQGRLHRGRGVPPGSGRRGARTEHPHLGRAGPAEGGPQPRGQTAHPAPPTSRPPTLLLVPSQQEAWLKVTSRERRSLIGDGSGGRPRPRGPTRGPARPAGTLCAGPGPRRAAALLPCCPAAP